MPDEAQAPIEGEGQAQAPVEETTSAQAPVSTEGQADPDYYDHKEFEQTLAELRANDATKAAADLLERQSRSMRKGWTQRQQQLAELEKANSQKIQAYDAFARDPATALQQLAQQNGYTLTRAQAQAQIDAQEEWEPGTWQDVRQTITHDAVTQAVRQVLSQLEPVVGTVRKIQEQTVEQQLEGIDPLWRRYEPRMTQLLQEHPTLSKDMSLLYSLAIPPEERESRATQAALKKIQSQTESARMESASPKRQTTPAPKKVSSFQDAVNVAREQGRSEGWYR